MTSLKPLSEQTIFLTGASSGIGLAAARLLAERGARVALAARGEDTLREVAREIEARGGRAVATPCDVADRASLRRAADEAEAALGPLDAWINDAGVAIYGAVTDVPWDEQRALFDTNYWGVVGGSLEALERFGRRPGPGKLINVGSVLSDRTMIYQGPYSASKHAVKAITDALRMELRAADRDVSVTLIKPGSINTPYMEHAKTYMDAPGTTNPPPSYDPELVAKAIAHACEHDVRDLVIGGGGWMIGKVGQILPGLTDRAMEATGRMMQTAEKVARPGMRDNVESAARGGEERAAMPSPPVRRSSLLLAAQMHPAATQAIGAAAVVAGAAIAGRRRA